MPLMTPFAFCLPSLDQIQLFEDFINNNANKVIASIRLGK